MSETFSILARFLDRFGPEVEGRAVAEVPKDIRDKLAGFARGELPEPERQEMIVLLQDNPHWIPALASEVKALRRPSATGTSSPPSL